MSSKSFLDLIKLIMGPYLTKVELVKKTINELDSMVEDEKIISCLYLTLSADEQSSVHTVVDRVIDATKKTEIVETIEINVSDVHRNEQVNIVALCEGIQTVLCSDLTHGRYYALYPMHGDSTKYELSIEGKNYQKAKRREYRENFSAFHISFIAKVYAYAPNFNNTVEFWEDMRNTGLFKYWDPTNGPYAYYQDKKKPEIQMLRIYDVESDLSSYITPNYGFNHAPKWTGGNLRVQAKSVLKDTEMEEQFTKFNEVLRKHGSPPAQKT